jgi:MFS family permease
MAATEAVHTSQGPRLGMAVAPLLTLALFIQYIDRGNIATAAPLIQNELHLSAAQIGLLVSAFYWVYVPGQPLTGWLAHRINAYRTLAIGLALWSLATIGTAFAGGFVALLALRFLLGLGESAFFPCSSRLLAQHLPAGRLGTFNGLIAIGLSLGPAVGTLVGGHVMALSGWRASFLIFGGLSLLWLAPWRQATRPLERADKEGPKAPSPSFWQVVRRREAWGAMTGQFFGNYGFYFVISWMPLYLVKQRGFSVGEMANVLAIVYAVQAASNLATGWIDSRWIASGASVNLVRKTLIIASHVLSGVALIFGALDNTVVVIACLLVASVGFGIGTPAIFAIGQTLAGPNAAGKWMGFQNGFANVAGIVGPVITGLIIDATHSYTLTFVTAGAATLAGVLCWGVIIPKVRPLDWSLEAAS